MSEMPVELETVDAVAKAGGRVGWPGRLMLRAGIAVALAAAAVAFFFLSGAEASTNDTLQVMGFDPDRARLLTSLMAAAMAAAIVALFGNQTALAVVVGVLAGAAGFTSTAWAETRAALAASGSEGVFDPLGWALSMATFVMVFAVASWAAAVLAREVRGHALGALGALSGALRGRGAPRRGVASSAATLVALVVVVVLMPILGDMLNYDPDTHMRSGAAAGAGAPLAGGGSGTDGGSSASDGGAGAGTDGAPAASFAPGLVKGPVAGSLITRDAVSTARPWASALPVGSGRIETASLPGPWTGGTSTSIGLSVYLPPGYDASTSRYPVFYEVPYALQSWQNGMQLPAVLDQLITSGELPPVIFVFVSAYGGPYPDSECADSYDGREWYDRFVGTDLVSWVDSTYRTIPQASARATFGFSQGGYCAAAIVTHHPDVFGSSLGLFGYFVAGIKTGTTPNAWRPFNGDPKIIDAVSPMTAVPRIDPAARSHLFYVMAADPGNPFYGGQMSQFSSVLAGAGVAQAVLPTRLGHSWDAARQLVPSMLQLVAGRMVKLGVFGPGG